MLIAAITAVTEGFLTARAGVVSSFYGLRRVRNFTLHGLRLPPRT